MWVETVDSTNNETSRHISCLDNLSVVSALSQSSGRGQRGNVWLSEPGENLTFSIVHKYEKYELAAKNQIVVSAIAALSVVALLSEYGIDAEIKWPNDIYVGEKKICGILIEHTVAGDYISHSIVGIGLNVNQCNFDVSLPNPTSIALCQDNFQRIDLDICLDQFMDIYKRNLCLMKDKDFSELHDLFFSKLKKSGSPIGEINLAWQQ